jgi:hypothetical protein
VFEAGVAGCVVEGWYRFVVGLSFVHARLTD